MNFSILNYKFSITLLNLLLIQPLALAASSRNLALHKKLEYAPKPEYHLTIHPRDPYLLTDGVVDESLWYEKYRDKTVGWVGANLVEISVDLGQIYNVGYVNVYTVGGGRSGVEYPEYAVAAASLDGNQYVFSSLASSDGLDFGANLAKPKVIKLMVEQKTRYIKLFVRPTGQFFFSDEIEVIESQIPELDSSSHDYLSKDQTIDLVEKVRQLQRDMETLKTRINGSSESKNILQSELTRMEAAIAGLARQISSDKVSEIESQFSIFRAKVLHTQYNTDWLLYQAEPMDILRYGDIPAKAPEEVQISLYQWQNEYSVAALNFINCSASQITFRVNLSPLRFQDRVIDSAGIFELRRAVYVRVLNAGLVADPLVLQNSKPFPVTPGQTVQLWLETYAEGLDLGQYTAALSIDAAGENIIKTQQVIPVKIEIADKIFPDAIPFFSCNWDYVSRSDRFTCRNPQNAVADLKNHHINVCAVLPEDIYESDTRGQFSLFKVKKELTLRKDIGNLFVLLCLGGSVHLERRFGKFGTPGWDADFNSFLTNLRDFMLSSGFDYNSFALYPFDEDIGDDFVYVAQRIRKFNPRLKIYANKWIEPGEFKRVKDLIDIWCPHIPEVLENKARFDQYKSSGVFDQIWCYHANIACERFFAPPITRTSREWRGDNKVFWRTMPIVAASLGMNGAGFWVYQDADRTGWIKDKMGEYGVVYDGAKNPDKNCIPEIIVPSKRWQQWRQGVEDAVCLSGHQDLLDEFLQKSNSKLNREYLVSLRKRADGVNENSK
jgi:hypothetical protein